MTPILRAEAAVIAAALSSAARINADAPARRLRYALNAKREARDTIRDLLAGRWAHGGWPIVSDRARPIIERWYRLDARKPLQLKKAA